MRSADLSSPIVVIDVLADSQSGTAAMSSQVLVASASISGGSSSSALAPPRHFQAKPRWESATYSCRRKGSFVAVAADAHSAANARSGAFACKASSSAGPTPARALVELPLFPLPLVLFPGAILPLQIFEFRYRIMMHTLLQTDLRFGVVFTDRSTGLAEVGCVGEVIKHERLVDDRFFLIAKGQERFRVVNLVRTLPYLVAEVEWIEDKPAATQDGGETEDVDKLADEVEAYMRDVIRLSNRMNKKGAKEAPQDLRKSLFPTPFSFWVASTFEGAPLEQQALLELEDTGARLRREKETLRNTLNYLTAASAVKDVFSSPSSD